MPDGRPPPSPNSAHAPANAAPDAPSPPAAAPDGAALPSGLVEVEERVVKWWHPLAMVVLLGALFIVFDQTGVSGNLRRGDLAEMREWLEGFGVLAPVVFCGVYLVATLVGVPASPLTFIAGAMFGGLEGIALALIAGTTAAIVAFVIARHFLRHAVNNWLRNNRRFQQLDRLTHQHGALVVLSVRLINVLPFFVVNYGFGITRVPFKTYALYTFIGRIPGSVVLVLIGDATYQAIIEGDVPWLLVALVLALLAALALVIRAINRRLKQSEREVEALAPPGDAGAP